MTRDEAVEITGMILANWVTPRWTEAQMEAFVVALGSMEPDLAVDVVALAAKDLQHRPSIADMHSYVKLARANRRMSEPDEMYSRESRTTTRDMPLWVRAWYYARFIADPPDRREFVEQHPHGPPPGVDLMPKGMYEDRVEGVSISDVMRAFGNAV